MTPRDVAILRAVATGHAEVDCGCLRIDGRWCCDQATAYQLGRAGLFRPAEPGSPGQRSAAVLTAAGYAELAGAP